MNIFEYLKETKRLNILNKELNSCNRRIVRLTNKIFYETYSSNIERYMKLIEEETEYRNYLKQQL